MRKSRFTDEQIIGLLKQTEAGASVQEVCRKNGVSPWTFYRWRSKFAGMAIPEARKLRDLEEENRRLKRLVADQALDVQMLKEAIAKKW